MPRPRKATVDYFSHDATHGSTMFVLESKWGNDGYAFWFKLLESIAVHESHYIDCRKPAEWELLIAKAKVDGITAGDILDTLARMEAIDPLLWSKKIIFCPKFLTRVADAYRKRIDMLPTAKTVYTAVNIPYQEFPAGETPINDDSSAGSTEREREREREIKHIGIPPETSPANSPEDFPSKALPVEKVSFAKTEKFQKCFDWFWKNYALNSGGKGAGGDKQATLRHLAKSIKSEKDIFVFCHAVNHYIEQTEAKAKLWGSPPHWKNGEVLAYNWRGFIPEDIESRLSAWEERMQNAETV